jgi:hypothetical protein
VAGSFTLGAGSNFDDLGIMSVAGPFDPGTGNPTANNTVGGIFTAASGSSVTTDAATWEVLAGGQLFVAGGASFTDVSGGSLLVDAGGNVTDQGSITVVGTLTSAQHGTIVVDYAGQLSTQGTGQFDNQGTLLVWNNPADIASGTPLGATQLNAKATSNGSPLAGTFSYTLTDDTTSANGAVLNAGNGQVLNVTFTPNDTADYNGASAQVSINVGGSVQTTPTVSAPSLSTTYDGAPQAYPTGSVTVTGVNGLNSSDGILRFTYNGVSTVPTNAGTYTVVVTFTPNDTVHYTIATTTTTWTIKQLAVNLTGSRTYDGTTTASASILSVANKIGNDNVTVVSGSGTLAGANAGLESIVSFGTLTLGGTAVNNYTLSGATGSVTIGQATPAITWTNPCPIASFTPLSSKQLNAVANVAGANGSGFVYSPAAGALLSVGTHTLSATFTPADSTNYKTATATVQLVVLGSGVTVVGNQVYFVSAGANSTSQVLISPAGSSNTGSTGITINGTTYSQSFSTINVMVQDGNLTVQMASSLTINAVVTGGNGNDKVQLGNGSNSVTLGNGNDTVQLGNGNNQVVVLGNGNDNVLLGNGSFDSVTVGTGNDTITFGNGSNNTVFLPSTGKHHDTITFGSGSNNTIQ